MGGEPLEVIVARNGEAIGNVADEVERQSRMIFGNGAEGVMTRLSLLEKEDKTIRKRLAHLESRPAATELTSRQKLKTAATIVTEISAVLIVIAQAVATFFL